jgi:hypothetical protein
MVIKVGVTTGLYYIAHDVSLASTVKKIGYTMTRGANVVEISGDTPHEISLTEGNELRNISRNQGMEFLFHGSLTVPMGMPERTDWRDAQDHMEKSFRSAVNSGCKYVLFHACLHFWVELLTYTGTKLTVTMCDHAGRFVSEILHESKRLRKWFIKYMRTFSEIPYPSLILTEEEIRELNAKVSGERGEYWMNQEIERQLGANEEYKKLDEEQKRINEDFQKGRIGLEEARRRASALEKKKLDVRKKVSKTVIRKASLDQARLARDYEDQMIDDKLSDPNIGKRKWRIDTHGRLLDIYKIMAHYLFFKKDPQWLSMAEVYKDVVNKYNMDYNDDDWLTRTWDIVERENDIEFKQFFYAVVGAKFLEGHLKDLLNWINNKYIPRELAGKPELQEIARNMQITIEIPDARDPKYAGRYMLSHTKQIFSAVKTLRSTLNTKRVWMTIDNEHLATQGFDPWVEGKKMMEEFPDHGEYVISVHCSYPTPLHSHYPIELGDRDFYTILWYLRKCGAGTKSDLRLIFERGGGDDPFRQSVDALKLMAKFLEKGVPPEKLPLEFYGLEKTAFDIKRQSQIMMDHRFDILKDLFEVPEEEWGLLSTAAVKKGKKEIFKKEELR